MGIKKFFTLFSIILILILITVGSLAFYPTSDSKSMPSEKNSLNENNQTMLPPIVNSYLPELEEPMNVLVAGIDKTSSVYGSPREGPYRADVIILARINPNTGEVNILNIPRDTRVEIPGHGKEKIAHAHAYGEMPLTAKTVEKLMDVNIDNYLNIDYSTFRKIVDILGGVEVNVPEELKTKYYHFTPGNQEMDGKKAYAYIKYRDVPRGDIARIERQKIFLQASIADVKKKAGTLDMGRIYLLLKRNIETSLSFKETLKLSLSSREIDTGNINMQTLPGNSQYINKISYWVINKDKLKIIKKEMFNSRS